MPTKTINTLTAKRFSVWLAQWMKGRRYTQLQTAVFLGIAPGHLNQILSGKSAASIFHMERIASLVNMDLLDILLTGRRMLAGDKDLEPIPQIDLASRDDLSEEEKAFLARVGPRLKLREERPDSSAGAPPADCAGFGPPPASVSEGPALSADDGELLARARRILSCQSAEAVFLRQALDRLMP